MRKQLGQDIADNFKRPDPRSVIVDHICWGRDFNVRDALALALNVVTSNEPTIQHLQVTQLGHT